VLHEHLGGRVLSRVPAPGAKTLAPNPKTETDLTADYADYTDTIGYDYQCPEVLPRKDLYVHPPITPSKSAKSAESAVSIPEFWLRRTANGERRRLKASSTIITIFLGVLAFIAPVRAQEQAANAATKLREMLRATMLQLRAAETEKATLQAAQTESAAKEKALTEQVEALTRQSAADKDASDKTISDLKAKVADQEQEIVQLKGALEKWKEGYAKAADIANAKEAERAKLAGQVILLDRKVADRESKNVELFRIGNEILKRYERFGLGDALLSREPFVGITRVKLENQVQDYQDKLLDQRIKPGQPVSTPAQASPSPSPAQKTKQN
jgi:hypothetical protein